MKTMATKQPKTKTLTKPNTPTPVVLGSEPVTVEVQTITGIPTEPQVEPVLPPTSTPTPASVPVPVPDPSATDTQPSASTLAMYFQILYNNLLQRTHQALSDLPHSPAIPTQVYELKAHVDSIINRSALHEYQFPQLTKQPLDSEHGW